MPTVESTIQILKNPKLHWYIKANAVGYYYELTKTGNFGNLAYDLMLNRSQLEQYIKLYKYSKFFPRLTDIHKKSDALRLLKLYEGDSRRLREMINILATQNKPKLLRAQIKKEKND